MQSTRSCFLHALILLEKTGLGAHMSPITNDFDGTHDPIRDIAHCTGEFDGKQDPARDIARCSVDFDFGQARSGSPHGAKMS